MTEVNYSELLKAAERLDRLKNELELQKEKLLRYVRGLSQYTDFDKQLDELRRYCVSLENQVYGIAQLRKVLELSAERYSHSEVTAIDLSENCFETSVPLRAVENVIGRPQLGYQVF
ncbi:MAG: hypothetical protein ACI4JA_07735 [Oscillospiraceae bacterium]